MPLTITEALAEIKTIGARVQKKREFTSTLLWRQETMRDPHEAVGGSAVVLTREEQGTRDLEERLVKLRRAIRNANETTSITCCEITRSIADWITWRREIAPNRKLFAGGVRTQLGNMRQEARKRGITVAGSDAGPSVDVVLNFSETGLAAEIDLMENILGQLDGQLSLKNATTIVNEEG